MSDFDFRHALFCVVLALAWSASPASSAPGLKIFVDPINGRDTADASSAAPLQTVHTAAAWVRQLRIQHPGADIVVSLMPGTHHVGDGPLTLGPLDGGRDGGFVTWRSADPSNPAVLGAPVRVTGWQKHPTNKAAMSAPLPGNITKGTPLRQLWVRTVRADRARIYGHGFQPGDNVANGPCLNLTTVDPTPLYPRGSQFDFSHENATDPTKWSNPTDVEFVYTSCDAINCWIEPRCAVQSVDPTTGTVSLHQGDNSTCYHRLYYYAQCFSNGKGPGRNSLRGQNPTHIENVEANWTQPGQFYYDRAGGTIGYILRTGETVADLEATATTTAIETILVVNGSKNIKWDSVEFSYATWLGASGPRGYIDTQSGYLCQEGEPPTNIVIEGSTDILFTSCTFKHLGAIYALGAGGASQGIIVSNSTFTDCSGGGVKLGSAGERGAPAPDPQLDPAKQDRGYLVSDNHFYNIPNEYSSANPIFAAYVADTSLVHNTIHNSRYSGICAGWGWGESSYTRNVVIENNSITSPMQLLADGGGVYTNTPCPNCHVSRNYFADDPHVYGCVYHDGGSALWNDRDNVFNRIKTSTVFAHGDSPGISVTPVYYNDSGLPSLEGATNHNLRNAAGVCIAATIVKLQPGQDWSGTAAEVVANAGRRTAIPTPVAPPLSPPINATANALNLLGCVRFAARSCDSAKQSQKWLMSSGVKPGDGQPTNVKSAIPQNASCWQANNGGFGNHISCDFDYNINGAHGGCEIPGASGKPGGDACRPLPNASAIESGATDGDYCAGSQAFRFNPNGTIALAMTRSNTDNSGKTHYIHHCLQILDKIDSADPDPVLTLGLVDCAAAGVEDEATPPGAPSQKWEVESNSDGTITIKQGSLCADNNFIPEP